jgi:hypothetical protein
MVIGSALVLSGFDGLAANWSQTSVCSLLVCPWKTETPRTPRTPRRGGEVTADETAKEIVDAAMKVHRALGPGLLE